MLRLDERAWHSYHGRALDLGRSQEMAAERLRDPQSPMESIIHMHAFEDGCAGYAHEFYCFDTE